MTKAPAPLDGVRVLDLTRVLAGPYCTLTLSDLGAEVIKVEEPTRGDDIRGMQISERLGISSYFLGLNRNKKSVGLDIRTQEGRDVILDLVQRSDVLIENYRAGVMDRNGLGYDSIKAANSSIIYAAISGYGREGPDKDRPGYDPVVQAESGLMSMTGEKDGAPMRTGISMIDIITGLFAGQAILAALYEREQSGKGQYVEVPLFDCGVNMLSQTAMAYLVDNIVMSRVGNASEAAMPVGAYQATDGGFTMALTSDRQFAAFCTTVLEQPELADDTDFATNPARVANSGRLDSLLRETFATAPRDHWLSRFAEAGIPAGPIRDIGEALRSPEVEGRNLITDAPHSSAGRVPHIRSPMHFSRTPVIDPVGAPLLGEHTEWVLRDVLGRSETDIDNLRKAGAIL
ncbi:MAG: CoA transferase [Rhodospirillaceae bacterium]|nr:CoA transferase [Rhodospirillaceae bacterium]MDD9918294.1 CoA transferase [Rhodospirillaceae bacterium]MDD9928351.1 CoA transferase [Rhodospirillaceae bacterium]